MRAEFLGSKPHSKGDVFSRSPCERIFSAQAARHVSNLRRDATITAISVIFMSRKYNVFSPN